MNHIKLTTEELNVDYITKLVSHESCGAISVFMGTTRDNFQNKKVLSLEYEAYEPMAKKQLNDICNEVRIKFPEVKNIAIYHRLGLVPVKDTSVVVAVCSPHRKASFEAVEHAVEVLKEKVAIWKKESYENNDYKWKENAEFLLFLVIAKDKDNLHAKSIKFNIDNCMVELDKIPQNLIQINADEEEVKRRIKCFIERKREEIDINNIEDFTEIKKNLNNIENTCARVNSTIAKQKDSKGHLRVHRVKNDHGPQTKNNYLNTLDKLMHENTDAERNYKNSLSVGVAERVENLENCLGLNISTSKDIYERIKSIENRVLFLESISPEYSHFMRPKRIDNIGNNYKRTYTLNELDAFVEKIKTKIPKSNT